MDSGINSSKPTTAQIIGGVYNATAPTLIDGQACSFQLDINGNLKVNVVAGGGGGGAGFGFATGAIVANSTGNTPANGFTLNDGADTSMTVVPSEIDFFNPSDSEITLALNGSNPSVAVSDSSGNSAALGFGGTNGASLVLDGAGGTSITLDGTVPSTTWLDGLGAEVLAIISSGQPSLNIVDAAGNNATLNTDGISTITFRGATVGGGNIGFSASDGATSMLNLVDSLGGSTQITSGVQTTVGGTGSASPLPALPFTYIIGMVGGQSVVIPCYLAS